MISDFLVFEIRKNLDLRKILVTPKIFLKSRFHCTKLFQKRGTIQGGHYSRGGGALFKEIRYVVSD